MLFLGGGVYFLSSGRYLCGSRAGTRWSLTDLWFWLEKQKTNKQKNKLKVANLELNTDKQDYIYWLVFQLSFSCNFFWYGEYNMKYILQWCLQNQLDSPTSWLDIFSK